MDAGVVITGMGIVSSIGTGREAFSAAYRRGERGVRPLSLFESPHYDRKEAAEVPGFDPVPILGKKNLRSCDRSTLLLLAATELLYRDLDLTDRDKRRKLYADDQIGIAIGALGSIKSIFDFDLETVKAPQFVTPTLFPNTVLCAAASYAAIRYGLQESCVTFSNDEVSALNAFDAGVGRLQRGKARQMVVGATHELSGIWAIARQQGWKAQGAPTPILGEGAVVFSLERREDAERAGHRCLAEVLGYAAAFCPDKRRGFGHVLGRLEAQAGADAVAEIGHLFSAQKDDLDEAAALPSGVRRHAIYPIYGYVSALTGALSTASALADPGIAAGAHVLIHTADPAGNSAALLLRKLVAD